MAVLPDFQRAGRQKLRDEVTKSGGARLWAKRLKLPYPERKPGYAPRWTEDRVRRDLEEFLRDRDHWPSRLEFEAAGRTALRDAIRRLGGPERWAAKFGLPLENLKFGSRLAWTDERIEAELRKALDGRDTWPTRRDLERRGVFGLATAIAHRGGTAYWARRLGREPPPRAGISRPGSGRTPGSALSLASSAGAGPRGRPSANSSRRESPRSTTRPAATGGPGIGRPSSGWFARDGMDRRPATGDQLRSRRSHDETTPPTASRIDNWVLAAAE